jgi:6-pyruvoyl-tetrahydropterin synthase
LKKRPGRALRFAGQWLRIKVKTELLLKFIFEASHSLADYEVPHPHLWILKLAVGGRPIQGRIIDIVRLRARIDQLIQGLKLTYLNDNPTVSDEVREFPTCETLSQYFYGQIQALLAHDFAPANPSVALTSVTIAICEMDGTEMGAARLFTEQNPGTGGR